MKIPEIPNVNELRKPRTPIDLKNWATEILKSFHTNEETKAILRFDPKMTRLKDEVYPLACYAVKQYPNNNVLVCPCADNGNRDGHITTLGGSLLETVEVTLAVEGEKRKLQLKQLEKHGFSALLTDQDFNKRKNLRKKQKKNYADEVSDCIACYQTEPLEDELKHIREIIVKKSKNTNYQEEITLCVVYNCNNGLTVADAWELDHLKALGIELKAVINHPFITRIVLLDSSDNHDLIEIELR